MEERIMDKVTIVFWSQSGNTESMANAVAEGVTAAGKEAVVVDVASASLDDLKAAKGFAMGCPAMGAEVLEEGEMEPFVCDVEGFAAGKTIALFGSYGWGDGQWMRDWVDRMTSAGATVINGEGVICQEAPDDDAVAACESLGKQLAGCVISYLLSFERSFVKGLPSETRLAGTLIATGCSFCSRDQSSIARYSSFVTGAR